MIDYNPEKHYDKLLNYIVEAYLAGEELDMPLLPHNNNGKTSKVLFTGEEFFNFPDREPYLKLFVDAEQLYKSKLNESQSSIYNWDCKPTEEGVLFTKDDKNIVMTSEPYWSKEEQNKKSEMEQWVEEKTQKLVEAGINEQEARKWACIGWVSHCIDTSEYKSFDYGDFRDLMTDKSNKQKQSHP